jgi:hypothetical protein
MSARNAAAPNWLVRLAILAAFLGLVYFGVSYYLRQEAIVVPAKLGVALRTVPGTVTAKAEFDVELKSDIDAALVAMRADGTLGPILTKPNLWDKRQTEAPPQVSGTSEVRKRVFDGDMFWQFVDAALVTLKCVISHVSRGTDSQRQN